MTLRSLLRSVFRKYAHEIRTPKRWFKRLVSNRISIGTYLRAHGVRKLQVGAGSNMRAGWLNGDIEPVAAGAIYLDATRRFPFADGEFDYIFTEHMFEHIPYAAGKNMLSECYRVLKPGGKIRICTPDLTRILHLLRADRSKLEEAYIAWAIREFTPAADWDDPVFVVNNYVRDWGHQFIYDEGLLARLLQKVGFLAVVRCQLGESTDPHLRGLENISRMPSGFLDIESMTVEAVKPPKVGTA